MTYLVMTSLQIYFWGCRKCRRVTTALMQELSAWRYTRMKRIGKNMSSTYQYYHLSLSFNDNAKQWHWQATVLVVIIDESLCLLSQLYYAYLRVLRCLPDACVCIHTATGMHMLFACDILAERRAHRTAAGCHIFTTSTPAALSVGLPLANCWNCWPPPPPNFRNKSFC